MSGPARDVRAIVPGPGEADDALPADCATEIDDARSAVDLEAEIVRLNKIIAALVRRAERHASFNDSEYGLFETAVVLEDKVQQRTSELERALRDIERLNRELRTAHRELRAANARLEELNVTDALTGVANRRGYSDVLEAEWQRAARNGDALAALMVDIDLFKAYNDCYGHLAGDACLRLVASLLQSSIRQGVDLVARYGGEEFVILLPGADAVATQFVSERVCRSVANRREPHQGSPVGFVTVSVGAAIVVAGPSTSPDALVAEADAALFDAKRAGRNRVAYGRGLGFGAASEALHAPAAARRSTPPGVH